MASSEDPEKIKEQREANRRAVESHRARKKEPECNCHLVITRLKDELSHKKGEIATLKEEINFYRAIFKEK